MYTVNTGMNGIPLDTKPIGGGATVQSERNSFLIYVVLDSVNMKSRDENSIHIKFIEKKALYSNKNIGFEFFSYVYMHFGIFFSFRK